MRYLYLIIIKAFLSIQEFWSFSLTDTENNFDNDFASVYVKSNQQFVRLGSAKINVGTILYQHFPYGYSHMTNFLF